MIFLACLPLRINEQKYSFMKPIALSIILIVFAGPLIGQTGHSPTGQMFMNHIYSCRYDSLIALEQITARMESKTKGMGFGGSEGGLIMDGEKSPVRIKSGDTIRFAIKIAMSMVDPSMMIMLYKFE